MKTTEENVMADNPKQTLKARSMSFYVFLGAALFAFIQSYSLLSPILLSFLLIFLIFTLNQSSDLPDAGVDR